MADDEKPPSLEEVIEAKLPEFGIKMPKSFAPAPMGRNGAMKNAWTMSKGVEETVDGTVISGQNFDAKISSTSPTVPAKPEPAPPAVAPVAAPVAAKESAPKKSAALHDILSKGRVQGMASLANDRMEAPAIKAWADE